MFRESTYPGKNLLQNHGVDTVHDLIGMRVFFIDMLLQVLSTAMPSQRYDPILTEPSNPMVMAHTNRIRKILHPRELIHTHSTMMYGGDGYLLGFRDSRPSAHFTNWLSDTSRTTRETRALSTYFPNILERNDACLVVGPLHASTKTKKR